MTEYVDGLLFKTGFKAAALKAIRWRRLLLCCGSYVGQLLVSVSVFFIGAKLATIV